MPLTLVNVGEETMIRKIGGKPEVRAHLENLGFVTGSNVTVISTIGGNLIVNVKNSRVAISREMARQIMVGVWLKMRRRQHENVTRGKNR